MKNLLIAATLLVAQNSFAAVLALDCRVQYQAGGELWHRIVTLNYDKKKLITVSIDDQPVYSFNAQGSTIRTSMDSERIRIEFKNNGATWHSSLRDISFGNGACVKIKS
jgi:hypothetical protein